MKLYYNAVSVTSRPVWLFLEEAKVPCELVPVDLMKGEHYQPPFTALNPNRLVPVLDDDGFVLTESSAILKYLADKVGSPLYPTERKARARVNERMDWFNTQFYRELGYHLVYPQVFPHHKRPDGAVQKGTLDWGLEKLSTALGVLDQSVLANSKFVCGDQPTIADYLGACFLSAGDWIGCQWDKSPNVRRWRDAMRALPSWKKVNEVHEGFTASLAGKDFARV
jgi:glutathione S-transferase